MDRRKVLLVAAVLMAVAGASLVFVYAQDAEDRAAEQLDTVPVLVATESITLGESFANVADDGKLAVVQVPADQVLPGATSDVDDLAGTYARTPLFTGEQLVADKFGEPSSLPLPEGTQSVTLDLDEAARLPARPGATVSVVVTPTDVDAGGAEVAASTTILDEVLVVAAGSRTVVPGGLTDIDGQPLPEVPDNLVTLAVEVADAPRLLDYEGSDDWRISLVGVGESELTQDDGTE